MIKEANSHIHKPEIRDVQVDDQVTVTRWSKRHVTRGSDKRSTNIVEWRKKTVETRAPSFEKDACQSKILPTSAHLLKIPFHTTAQF